MSAFPTKIILIYFLFFGFSSFSQGQDTHTIEFNAEGKMTVAPPNALPDGDYLQFQVNIDENSFEKKTLGYVEFYISTLEKLTKSSNFNYLFKSSKTIEKYGHVIGKEVESVTPYLSKSQQLITKNRIEYYRFPELDSLPNTPKLKDLIQIDYYVKIDFFKASGEKNGETGIYNLKETEGFPNSLKAYSLISDEIKIPNSTASINFELREIEPKNEIIKNRAESLDATLIKQLEKSLSEAGKKIDKNFFAGFAILKEKGNEAKKYLENPKSIDLDQSWLDTSNTLFDSLNKIANDGLFHLKTPSVSAWMLSWFWLTQGSPKINPFFFQEEALFSKQISTVPKVSEKEKILVEMFDNMVKNSAFQIETLSNIFNDSQLGQIADIKTKLKAEGVVASSAFEYDKFLYSGTINSYDAKHLLGVNLLSSSVPITYMASHNATLDFLLMTENQKEIKDIDQLEVLIQNKKPEGIFKIEANSATIDIDNGIITDEFLLSGKFEDSEKDLEDPIYKEVKSFFENYKALNLKIEFFTGLQKAPKLPIVTVKDEDPSYQTEILNYNQNIDSPAITEYKIKSGTGDDEKEVYKGQFRVNKRYNLRFKAGAVYSALEQKDYTKSGDNTFTEEIKQAGIDGTFGIQVFPIKTDLRQINIIKGRVAPFIYMGFSMKNILENFYPGIGLEIFSGLAISYNRHIGISEVLTSDNSLPQGIATKWKGGDSISLLVDGSLFVNLFKFGSNKGSVGF